MAPPPIFAALSLVRRITLAVNRIGVDRHPRTVREHDRREPTPRRARSFSRPPRSTAVTPPLTREPAGIATRLPTLTARA